MVLQQPQHPQQPQQLGQQPQPQQRRGDARGGRAAGGCDAKSLRQHLLQDLESSGTAATATVPPDYAVYASPLRQPLLSYAGSPLLGLFLPAGTPFGAGAASHLPPSSPVMLHIQVDIRGSALPPMICIPLFL